MFIIKTIKKTVLFCMAVLVIASAGHRAHAQQESQREENRVITHGAHHATDSDPNRFITNRDVPALPLPSEDDAFFFVIFGDRTGGPPEGVEVLAEAVGDVNLLEPDFVMTVGDLIQGYNQTEGWLTQMREYKGIMNNLLCPWFPVAGNHDVYWRGPDKPDREHEANYEMHFGPLWYAFKHKDCWFIVLFSDEGDMVTGEKTFQNPSAQAMSNEQFSWLKQTLDHAAEAQHVFVFLHHPRWLRGGYGDDWEKVHEALAAAGNVRAVFAGHIHRMRYDGPRDGIEYVTLATTGGGQSGVAPRAGYLHHFHTVTVRRNQIALGALPVGEVMDVRAITGKVSDDARLLSETFPEITNTVSVSSDGSVDAMLNGSITNPASVPIEVTLAFDSLDSRWGFSPDHQHQVIQPGDSYEFSFGIRRTSNGIDDSFRVATFRQSIDYLAERFRYELPARNVNLPLRIDIPTPQEPRTEMVVELDGENDYLRVPNFAIDIPDGPLTVECWFNVSEFAQQMGLVTKTEASEFGLFAGNATPAFYIFLDDAYVVVSPEEFKLKPNQWYHAAGVYDGSECRLYVDGKLVARKEGSGSRRTNGLPLLVGADVAASGDGVFHYCGQIDEVRLSSVARYSEEQFHPQRRLASDEYTELLLHMDGSIAQLIHDASGNKAHAEMIDTATLAPAVDNK